MIKIQVNEYRQLMFHILYYNNTSKTNIYNSDLNKYYVCPDYCKRSLTDRIILIIILKLYFVSDLLKRLQCRRCAFHLITRY